MSNSLVSVIIPAYNVEKVIVDALDSVYAQTYRPIEVIVIDDGSTDTTPEIVNNYKKSSGENTKEDAPIYIRQENSGPSRARNTGIRAAHGECIAFLDADDLWMADKLEKQIALFRKDTDIDIAFCNVRTTKVKNGNVDTFSMFDRNGVSKNYFGHNYLVVNPLKKLLKLNFMLTPAVIAKKSCFRDGIFFNEKRQYAEDWELWLKMSLHYNFGYINDVCVHVRDEGDGLCTREDKMLLSCLDILDDFLRENIREVSSRISQRELSQQISYTYQRVGYYFVNHNNKRLARKLLKKSLQEDFAMNTLLYYLKSLLPVI